MAEDVEDQEMAGLIRGMQPVMVQGYYYSRPLPADQFSQDLLEKMGATDLEYV